MRIAYPLASFKSCTAHLTSTKSLKLDENVLLQHAEWTAAERQQELALTRTMKLSCRRRRMTAMIDQKARRASTVESHLPNHPTAFLYIHSNNTEHNVRGTSSTVRRFHSPKVLRFSYTLLQTLNQSPHFLSTKSRVRVKVRISENACRTTGVKPSDFRHTTNVHNATEYTVRATFAATVARTIAATK